MSKTKATKRPRTKRFAEFIALEILPRRPEDESEFLLYKNSRLVPRYPRLGKGASLT